MIKYFARHAKPALAYCQVVGKKSPGVIFLSGFMSNMNGQKALALEDWCRLNDHPFVRFDYHGTGSSKGPISSFHNWVADAMNVLENLTQGPQVVIGSSMGGFIMLHLAKKYPKRIAGLIGIAPSFYFLNTLRMWQRDNRAVRDVFRVQSSHGKYEVPNNFFECLNQLELFPNHMYDLSCPLRVIHGMQDESVPWKNSLDFVENRVNTDADAHITLRKQGNHRLSTDEDIRMLLNVLECLINEVQLSQNCNL